jgi:2,4-dienoyl-CoA reductase (NADPH2)
MVVGQDLGLTLDMERFHRQAHGAGIVMSPDRTVLHAVGAAPGVRLTVLHHTVGAVSEAAYDWVVCAVPPVPENKLWTALRDRGPAVHRIGDCLAPRRAHAAVMEGYRVGVAL